MKPDNCAKAMINYAYELSNGDILFQCSEYESRYSELAELDIPYNEQVRTYYYNGRDLTRLNCMYAEESDSYPEYTCITYFEEGILCVVYTESGKELFNTPVFGTISNYNGCDIIGVADHSMHDFLLKMVYHRELIDCRCELCE